MFFFSIDLFRILQYGLICHMSVWHWGWRTQGTLIRFRPLMQAIEPMNILFA